jgi:S-adenosylhomocysteine hydrolase
MVGNPEVGHEILAKFEVPLQSQLDSMGIQVDKLTNDQEQYLASWSEGT